MRLSTKGRYGLRAMVDLAIHDTGNEPVSLTSIAERQEISESYLEQLVRKLRTKNLVVSVRGAGGGYRLARPADQISVGDVLRALEGDIEVVACGAEDGDGCGNRDHCIARSVWVRVNRAVEEAVDTLTLQQLIDENG